MKKTLLFLSAALMAIAPAFAQPVIKQQTGYGGSSWDDFGRMCVTKDGGVLIGGWAQSDTDGNKTIPSKGGPDYWLIKQDKIGNKIWEKAIGGNQGDRLTDMKPTFDGGYILVGSSASDISGDKTEHLKGQYDYWVVKVNSKGEVKWDKTIGGNEYDDATSIEQTADSGYIVAGSTTSRRSGNHQEVTNGGRDAWIVKLNKTGKIIWQNTLGGTGYDGKTYDWNTGTNYYNFHSVICKQTPDGSYLVGTVSDSPISGDKTEGSHGGSDYWLVKLDSIGNVVWDKTIGGTGNDYLNALEPTADGGYLLGGYSNSPASYQKTAASEGGFDYWLLKIDNAGNVLWDKTIGGTSDDMLEALQQTADGGYVLAGLSWSGKSGIKSDPNFGVSDYWIVKTDATGSVLWNKTIGGSGKDWCLDVKEVAQDTFYIGGTSTSGISGNKKVPNYGIDDYWVAKLIYNAATSGLTAEAITGNQLSNENKVTNAQSFLVYPNPATSLLHIQNVGKATFILSDQSGKRMLTKILDGNGELNVANVPAGTYYLTNTTTAATQKVIITK